MRRPRWRGHLARVAKTQRRASPSSAPPPPSSVLDGVCRAHEARRRHARLGTPPTSIPKTFYCAIRCTGSSSPRASGAPGYSGPIRNSCDRVSVSEKAHKECCQLFCTPLPLARSRGCLSPSSSDGYARRPTPFWCAPETFTWRLMPRCGSRRFPCERVRLPRARVKMLLHPDDVDLHPVPTSPLPAATAIPTS